MLFENPPIEIETLPAVETIPYQPLQPRYLTLAMTSTVIFLMILLVAGTTVMVAIGQMGYILALLVGWAVFAGLILVITKLGFAKKGYALRDRDLVYKTGLIWRSVTTLPFNRVQHCEVNQGPLEKYLGLAKLKVYTAGGQGSDLVVPGLTPDTAHKLKDFILKKTSDG